MWLVFDFYYKMFVVLRFVSRVIGDCFNSERVYFQWLALHICGKCLLVVILGIKQKSPQECLTGLIYFILIKSNDSLDAI